MTYRYTAKKDSELEAIAEAILSRFPKRRRGRWVDIEGILEDLGLDLLPRRGFRKYAEGYLATDPSIIVIDESILTFMPRARFTIAEEVAHLVLEYDLWEGGEVPHGAKAHALSEEQHFFIEKDAKGLAAAILMPERDVRALFDQLADRARRAGIDRVNFLRSALVEIADELEVSKEAAYWRARKLKLITKEDEGALGRGAK